jgi:hypothetical protein
MMSQEKPMECSLPPALTDEQLFSVLDEEADEATLAHLARCLYCQERIREAAQLETTLGQALHRWDCPTAQVLGDYLLGLLLPEAADDVVAHLAICSRCRQELQDLGAVLEVEEAGLKPALRPIPSSPPLVKPARRPVWQELVARLLPQVAQPVLRGEAPDLTVAEAERITFFLAQEPGSDGQVILKGQLVAEDQATWIGALVQVFRQADLLCVTEVGEAGIFRCELPVGEPVRLRVAAARGDVVVVPEVPLGGPRA